MNHSIYALDTFFSSIESFGKKEFPDTFVVEKITGSRLHMYVLNDIVESYKVVEEVVKYAGDLMHSDSRFPTEQKVSTV